MKPPLISVITPSYNQGKFIRATIESVLSQDYPNLEYIVVDGGSQDETLSILKSYGKKLHFLSEADHGQSDAINKGLRIAKGDVLCYLNSDDILLPGSLSIVGTYFMSHKNCNWATGDCHVIGEDGQLLINHNWLISGYKRLLLRFYTPSLLKIVDNIFPQPSTFWSRKAYERVGEFSTHYHYVMDYDYWLRLSKYYRPHDLKRVLSGFRMQPNSKSETSRALLIAEGNLALKANGAKNWQLLLHKIHSDIMRFTYNLLSK